MDTRQLSTFVNNDTLIIFIHYMVKVNNGLARFHRSIDFNSTTMMFISIAHHGNAVDNIRFDSCRTITMSGIYFSAAPNFSRNAGKIFFV